MTKNICKKIIYLCDLKSMLVIMLQKKNTPILLSICENLSEVLYIPCHFIIADIDVDHCSKQPW